MTCSDPTCKQKLFEHSDFRCAISQCTRDPRSVTIALHENLFRRDVRVRRAQGCLLQWQDDAPHDRDCSLAGKRRDVGVNDNGAPASSALIRCDVCVQSIRLK